MLTNYFSQLDESKALPVILVVGCGHVGESIVKAFVDNVEHGMMSIYVTDSDKDKARKLSEYRLSMITPIRWRNAHDTPDDVDIIVVAVDHTSEEKIIDRLALANKPFVTMSDDATVFDEYEEYEDEFKQAKCLGIVGAGLVPGISEVLIDFFSSRFDEILDISVDRMGFVSGSSLDSLKSARRESPLCVRDGIISDLKRDAGSTLTWFPNPIGFRECQSVSTGVITLLKEFPETHNLTVKFAEPKLPTFTERVRNLLFKVPLTTTLACVRVELHGLKDGQIKTEVYTVFGDAMTMITHVAVMSIVGLFNLNSETYVDSPLISVNKVIDSATLLCGLSELDVSIFRFDGSIN